MTTKPTTENQDQVCQRQVWRFVLPADTIRSSTTIKLPRTFKILHVNYQPGYGVCLWIEVPVAASSGKPISVDSPEYSQAHKQLTTHWREAADEVFQVVPTGADIPVHQATLASPGPRWYLCSQPPPYDHGPTTAPCPFCEPIHPAPAHPASVESPRAGYVHIGTAIDRDFGYEYHVYWLTQLA